MSEVSLRAREPTDSAAIAGLMNLPGVRHGTLRVPFVSRGFADGWGMGGDNSTVLAERDAVVVGVTMLMRGRERTAHTGSILIFVHDDHVGTGVGTALMTAVLDLADRDYGLRRVALTVNADNARAVHLYEKFGFEVEGCLRGDVLRDGVFVDSLAMARLRF